MNAGTDTRVKATLVAAGALLALALPATSFARTQVDPNLSADAVALQIEREQLTAGASAAAARKQPLPLPRPSSSPAAQAQIERSLSGSSDRRSLLVGVHTHADVDSVARDLQAIGSQVNVIDSLGVISVTASPAEVVDKLGNDPRVDYVEPNRKVSYDAEFADNIDPETGIPYEWQFNAVQAGPAIQKVNGGSSKIVSMVDSGLDRNHPDLAGKIASTYDVITKTANTTDIIGHGTFTSGLVAMVDGNMIGGKGVAGNTKIMGVRIGADAPPTIADVIEGVNYSRTHGANIVNLSLGGEGFSTTEERAFEQLFLANVLPVAAAGNSAEFGNPPEFPAAAIGGDRGEFGIGLSVGAVKPDGKPAVFSNHNDAVSLAGPGADQVGMEHGVFSTLPTTGVTAWDDPQSPNRVFGAPNTPSGRWAYGEGTSFSAPIAAGISALAWQANGLLRSDQVGHVLMRTANQTFTPKKASSSARIRTWNEFTGTGVVNGSAAVDLAPIYDTTDPTIKFKVRRKKGKVRATISGKDRTEPGKELAGGITYSVATARSKKGGGLKIVIRPTGRKLKNKKVRMPTSGKKRFVIGSVCDANMNCSTSVKGPFKGKKKKR